MSDPLFALRLFVRVARTGSFSRAAREYGLSQPTASRVIASLEDDVGAALFTRTTRAVTLTEAGADYLARVEPILDALDEANHAVRGTGELRGVLRVGVSSTLAVRKVIPSMPAFTAAHPALRLEFLLSDARQDLVVEGVDVALRFGRIDDSTAVAKHLAEWPRIIAASPAYLAARGIPQTPSDLAAHIAIAGPTATGYGWNFSKDGRELSVRMESRVIVTLHEAAIAAATAGLGIVNTLLPGCRQELESGALVRLLPDWHLGTFALHAVFPGGRAAKPSARAFVEFLKAQLAASESPAPPQADPAR